MAVSLAFLPLPTVCTTLQSTTRGSSSQRPEQQNGRLGEFVVGDCRRWRLPATRSMAPEDKRRMTRRSPLDFPVTCRVGNWTTWRRRKQCSQCLAFVDRRGLGIANSSRLSAFQEFGLYVDNSWRGRTAQHICLSLQSPDKKGFGKPPTKKKTVEKKADSVTRKVPESTSEGGILDSEAEDDVVPEVVTNRMLKRISLTVGVPLAVGVLFFPLFYYLKVVKKVDVPEWLPLLTSMLTFGTAGLGITYGVLSSSWDPARGGSLLGWKEAQLNWPVFLETLQGKKEKK